ncbi:hypothetical protein MAR_021249 [Mya arenaria]|uniref:Uncharacterized protein n=1 Tax=Mya arenaria TaxID=6604 RepID=A0ABY7E7N8_MYAAR|nr:hypothetical protein MAR_021249 [Mya arenaria]
MHSCDATIECLEETVTERPVHAERPSNEDDRDSFKTFQTRKKTMVFLSRNISSTKTQHMLKSQSSINELVYAEVDVEHLDKFRVGNRACNDDKPTEYSDIVFDTSCGVKSDSSHENMYEL